jgi:hypothetical protein
VSIWPLVGIRIIRVVIRALAAGGTGFAGPVELVKVGTGLAAGGCPGDGAIRAPLLLEMQDD